MRRIFTDGKGKKSSGWKIIVPVACFVVVLALVIAGIGNVSRSTREQQLKIAQEAVRRAAVQCYAIEGRYPSGLDYLEDHYGLIVDEDRFVYSYRCLGDNLMPEIFVFPA